MPSDVLPFLKWAGGKRWFATHFARLGLSVERSYIEPFMGSAAVFFSLKPKSAILSDTNEDLVDTYQAIKDDWKAVRRLLSAHHKNHNKNYYYLIRDRAPTNQYIKAARFIYLNRTCWNGLYRVNQQGAFNVPIGTKTNVLLKGDDFSSVADRLKNCNLLVEDFESTINRAGEGDLVFADPPYTVRHNLNGFIKYNEKLFSWDDQIRLRDALLRASHRGANIVSTNADHRSVRDLYRRDFSVGHASRFSSISGLSKSRGEYSELVITNKEV